MSGKRSVLLNWGIPAVAAVAVIAVAVAWQWPQLTGSGQDARSDATQPTQANADAIPTSSAYGFDDDNTNAGLAKSADHVRIMATRREDQIITHITVDDGWHINTNPAALDFLIPTKLTLDSNGKPLDSTVDYPKGHDIDVGLDQPISVFSNNVKLTASMKNAPADEPVQALVRVQACSDKGRCLMPSTVKVTASTEDS